MTNSIILYVEFRAHLTINYRCTGYTSRQIDNCDCRVNLEPFNTSHIIYFIYWIWLAWCSFVNLLDQALRVRQLSHHQQQHQQQPHSKQQLQQQQVEGYAHFQRRSLLSRRGCWRHPKKNKKIKNEASKQVNEPAANVADPWTRLESSRPTSLALAFGTRTKSVAWILWKWTKFHFENTTKKWVQQHSGLVWSGLLLLLSGGGSTATATTTATAMVTAQLNFPLSLRLESLPPSRITQLQKSSGRGVRAASRIRRSSYTEGELQWPTSTWMGINGINETKASQSAGNPISKLFDPVDRPKTKKLILSHAKINTKQIRMRADGTHIHILMHRRMHACMCVELYFYNWPRTFVQCDWTAAISAWVCVYVCVLQLRSRSRCYSLSLSLHSSYFDSICMQTAYKSWSESGSDNVAAWAWDSNRNRIRDLDAMWPLTNNMEI